MIYKTFNNEKVSLMGLGAVELPCINGANFGNIKDPKDFDIAEIERMYDTAMFYGVNYFETAHNYHNGLSEPLIAKVLKKFPREHYNLAAKYIAPNPVESFFEQQLKDCEVDYFDFYLIQSVKENNFDDCAKAVPYLVEQVKNGRIRHLGFSSHMSISGLTQWLEQFNNDMEFCQIQLNWLDWEYNNARDLVDVLRRFKKPIWVMCPLKHGMIKNAFDPSEFKTDWVETSLRFLQSIPEVTLILNGACCEQDIKENVAVLSRNNPTTDVENKKLLELARKAKPINCINCGYCLSGCPKQIDIPTVLRNINFDTGKLMPLAKDLYRCIDCKHCENVCTQKLPITSLFKRFK